MFLPSDLANYICKYHNPHKEMYDKVVRELVLKHLNESQLLLIKLTKKSRYTPYFITEREPLQRSQTVWLAEIDPFYDGSWGRLLCTFDEFMEFFNVKVCHHWWQNDAGNWWNVEDLRTIFDDEYDEYLDQVCLDESDEDDV
jgi:hypothetical protein